MDLEEVGADFGSSHRRSAKAASMRRNSPLESQAQATMLGKVRVSAKRRDTTALTWLLRAVVDLHHHHGVELLTVTPLGEPAPVMEQREPTMAAVESGASPPRQ